jgi:putative ABC transport system ATP-binding protein
MIVLETENLSKRFPSGQGYITVLDGITLQIEKGESVAITGPSGSGKSTLLGLLAGLDSPSEGRIIIEGNDLGQMTEEEITAFRGKRMGFMFQSYRLLPTLTAEENVRVPLELAGDSLATERAHEWLKQVGLEHRLNHFPAQLSGGEQQRVALARALAPQPALLFADEPTGNLDSTTGLEMADLIFSLVTANETTLLLVTHELSLSKRAGRIISLKDGRVAHDTLNFIKTA